MTIKSKITRGASLGLVGLASMIGVGCQTTPFVDGLGEFAIYQTVGSAISGKLDPRGTNVNVNVNGNQPKTDYVFLKEYCSIDGKQVIQGNILRLGENDFIIFSNGQSYNLEYKDTVEIIDN